MSKTLLGALLVIIGVALFLLSERFGDQSPIALIAGLVLVLLGGSMVDVVQDYMVKLEWASKRNKREPRE